MLIVTVPYSPRLLESPMKLRNEHLEYELGPITGTRLGQLVTCNARHCLNDSQGASGFQQSLDRRVAFATREAALRA